MIVAFKVLLFLWVIQSVGLVVEAFREYVWCSGPMSPEAQEWLRLSKAERSELGAEAFSESPKPVVVTFRVWLFIGFCTGVVATLAHWF